MGWVHRSQHHSGPDQLGQGMGSAAHGLRGLASAAEAAPPRTLTQEAEITQYLGSLGLGEGAGWGAENPSQHS